MTWENLGTFQLENVHMLTLQCEHSHVWNNFENTLLINLFFLQNKYRCKDLLRFGLRFYLINLNKIEENLGRYGSKLLFIPSHESVARGFQDCIESWLESCFALDDGCESHNWFESYP